MNPFRTADNWSICPSCKKNFGWNNCDGLVGQMCSCGYVFSFSDRNKIDTAPNEQICNTCHEWRPDVENGFCPHCHDDSTDDDTGGCESFSVKVTPDILHLAEEMAQCICDCGLDEDEMTKYIANMIADICPNYKE